MDSYDSHPYRTTKDNIANLLSQIYSKLNPSQQLKLRLFQIQAEQDFETALSENVEIANAILAVIYCNVAKQLIIYGKFMEYPSIKSREYPTAILTAMANVYFNGQGTSEGLSVNSYKLCLWVAKHVRDPILYAYYASFYFPSPSYTAKNN